MSRKLHHTYSFAIQRTTWKNCLAIIILEIPISVTQKNVFRINFVFISDWRVDKQRGQYRQWMAPKRARMPHKANGEPRSGEASGPGSLDGTRLVAFPRPNRPQFEKATSRDHLSSRDPLPLAPSQGGAEGG